LQKAPTLGASQPTNHKYALRQALFFGRQTAKAAKARAVTANRLDFFRDY